jgi:hypothetical protein
MIVLVVLVVFSLYHLYVFLYAVLYFEYEQIVLIIIYARIFLCISQLCLSVIHIGSFVDLSAFFIIKFATERNHVNIHHST